MPRNLISDLARMRKKVARLEEEAVHAQAERLRSLPGELGFHSIRELIAALRMANVGGGATVLNRKAKGRKPRVRMTEESRAAIVEAAKNGKTGAQIAAEFGASIATVHKIRKAAGLVRTR